MFKVPVLTVLIVCRMSQSAPIDTASLLSDIEDAENYDVIIDQRQNGTQNFRIKVHGLSIAIPDDREEPQPPSSSLGLEQFVSLLAPQTAGGTHHVNDNIEDFAELASFFDWKKKSGEKKNADTQSRTKDIPTEAQLADHPKLQIKERVKEEQRRYKLLVGEKYIVPILRFLKKAAEDEKE